MSKMETSAMDNADLLDQIMDDVPWHLTDLDDCILGSSTRSAPTKGRYRTDARRSPTSHRVKNRNMRPSLQRSQSYSLGTQKQRPPYNNNHSDNRSAKDTKRSPSSRRLKNRNTRPSLQRAQSYSLGSQKQRSRNHPDSRLPDKKETSIISTTGPPPQRQKRSRLLLRSKSTSKIETDPSTPSSSRPHDRPRKDNSRTRRQKKQERSDQNNTCHKAGFLKPGTSGANGKKSSNNSESKLSDKKAVSSSPSLFSPVSSRRNMFTKSKSLRILSTTGSFLHGGRGKPHRGRRLSP